MVFPNTPNLLLVLVNLRFALAAAMPGVFAIGGLLSIGAMVGLVTLIGITMRNSMLISHFEHLVENEKMTWGIEQPCVAHRNGWSDPDVTALGLLRWRSAVVRLCARSKAGYRWSSWALSLLDSIEPAG